MIFLIYRRQASVFLNFLQLFKECLFLFGRDPSLSVKNCKNLKELFLSVDNNRLIKRNNRSFPKEL
ncbi:hypothetical protein DB44_CJ00220 [Candidatus Protochlamydia amoebophila]|uniref:Uncharacterized protein n=1 Tax=Candidatus Protochlamydia amoebophila TaxID=362787 RepID=A0A0C1HC95_9BACT|nr:hypothetical protein DB44_CJ00220 [Candidatus Protochlamydia amoebophila]